MPISPLLKYSPLLMTTSVMASNSLLPDPNANPVFSPGKVTYETANETYQSEITDSQLEKVREHFGHLVASHHINAVRHVLPKYHHRQYHYPIQLAKAESNISIDTQNLPIVLKNNQRPDYSVQARQKPKTIQQNHTIHHPNMDDERINEAPTQDTTDLISDLTDDNDLLVNQTDDQAQPLSIDQTHQDQVEQPIDSPHINTLTTQQPKVQPKNYSIAPVVNPTTADQLQNNTPTTTPNVGEVQTALTQQLQRMANANYDLAQLQQDPVEFTKFLNIALAAKDLATVKETLPFYKQLSINDPFLIQYADAFVARSEGKTKQAIDIYRKMLADDPNLPPVRLNLAQTLYADQQLDFAKQQFMQLRAEDNIPTQVRQLADYYIEQINQQTKIKSYVTAQFVKSKNLNNVPETPIDTSFGTSTKPIDDTGFRVNVGTSKRIPLKGNFYTEVGFNGNHTHYFKQDDYNDSSANLALSFGYANAKTDIQIKPNINKRFYGGHQLNTQNALSVSGTHWLNPKVRLGLVTQYGKRKHENREYHIQDGDNHYLGANALYLLDGKSYVFGGINRYHNDTKSPDDYLSYVQLGVNAGIGKEWQKGISTVISGGYHELQYQGINDLFVKHNGQPNERRHDKVLNLGLTAWKRDWHFLGFTPKFNVEYNRTDSNYSYYQRGGQMMVNAFVSRDF